MGEPSIYVIFSVAVGNLKSISTSIYKHTHNKCSWHSIWDFILVTQQSQSWPWNLLDGYLRPEPRHVTTYCAVFGFLNIMLLFAQTGSRKRRYRTRNKMHKTVHLSEWFIHLEKKNNNGQYSSYIWKIREVFLLEKKEGVIALIRFKCTNNIPASIRVVTMPE
jgi:hypothetical protein